MPQSTTRPKAGGSTTSYPSRSANSSTTSYQEEWNSHQQFMDESFKVIESHYSGGVGSPTFSPVRKQSGSMGRSSNGPGSGSSMPPSDQPPKKRSPERRTNRRNSPAADVSSVALKKASSPTLLRDRSDSNPNMAKSVETNPLVRDRSQVQRTRSHQPDSQLKANRVAALKEDDKAKSMRLLKTIMDEKEQTRSKYEAALDTDVSGRAGFYAESPKHVKLSSIPAKKVAEPSQAERGADPEWLKGDAVVEAHSDTDSLRSSQSPSPIPLGREPALGVATGQPAPARSPASSSKKPTLLDEELLQSSTTTYSKHVGSSDDKHVPMKGLGFRSAAADMRPKKDQGLSPKGGDAFSKMGLGVGLGKARKSATAIQAMLRYRLSCRIAAALKPDVDLTGKALPTLQSHLRALRSGASKAELTAVLAIQPFVKCRLAQDERQRRSDFLRFKHFALLKCFVNAKVSTLELRRRLYRSPLPMKTISIAIRVMLFFIRLRRRYRERCSGVVERYSHRCVPFTELITGKTCAKICRKKLLEHVCPDCQLVYSPATRRLMAEVAVDQKFIGLLRLFQCRARLHLVMKAVKADATSCSVPRYRPRPSCFPSSFDCCERCLLTLNMFEGKPLRLLHRLNISTRTPLRIPRSHVPVTLREIDELATLSRKWKPLTCYHCFRYFTMNYVPLWQAALKNQLSAVKNMPIARDFFYPRERRAKVEVTVRLISAWFRFRRHLQQMSSTTSSTTPEPRHGSNDQRRGSRIHSLSVDGPPSPGYLGEVLRDYVVARCVSLGCHPVRRKSTVTTSPDAEAVEAQVGALGRFQHPEWAQAQRIIYLVKVRSFADASQLLPVLLRQHRTECSCRFAVMRFKWVARRVVYGGPNRRASRILSRGVSVQKSSRKSVASPTARKAGGSPTNSSDQQSAAVAAAVTKEEMPTSKAPSTEQEHSKTPPPANDDMTEDGSAKPEVEEVEGEENRSGKDAEPTNSGQNDIQANADGSEEEQRNEEVESPHDHGEENADDASPSAIQDSEDKAVLSSGAPSTIAEAPDGRKLSVAPMDVNALKDNDNECDSEDEVDGLGSTKAGLSTSLASADAETTTITWATGHVTNFCSERCFMFGELLAQQQVQHVDLKGRAIVQYLNNMCVGCKELIIQDLLIVRKVLRIICVLQCRLRWRLMRRRRVLEQQQAMGGVSPLLITQQAASSKGRCGRCQPFLEILERRIRYFRRHVKQQMQQQQQSSYSLLSPAASGSAGLTNSSFGGRSDVSEGDDSSPSNGASPMEGSLFAPSPSHKSTTTKSLASGGYDYSTTSLSMTMSRSGPIPGLSPRSTTSLGFRGVKKGTLGGKEKKQFVQETSQLIFEMCERCQCIAKAQLKQLK